MTDWSSAVLACPRCGMGVEANAGSGTCAGCAQAWTQAGNITTWHSSHAIGDERAVPVEWLRGRSARGFERARYLAGRAAWGAAKIVAYPVRRLFQARLAAFQRRCFTDRALADAWRRRYLEGIALGPDSLVFEYSYRKAEKVGYAGLLGFRIVVQDIRRQSWWSDAPHVRFQVVPPDAARLPLRDAAAAVVFVDGVIFDLGTEALEGFFRECRRVLQPGGSLVIWGGNSLSPSRARSEIRWHGRIHPLAEVRGATARAGFREADVSFEGFAPPLWPEAWNMLRLALAPWPVKTHDHDSWLARLQSPERRAYWLLRLNKPAQ